MKKIGIIGAMPSELKDIQGVQESPVTMEIAGFSFFESKHGENEIVTACCGIGKVNAALCTQIMIDRFGVDCIINTGIAGSLCADLDIGDLVISTDEEIDIKLKIADLNVSQVYEWLPYTNGEEVPEGREERFACGCASDTVFTRGIKTFCGRLKN